MAPGYLLAQFRYDQFNRYRSGYGTGYPQGKQYSKADASFAALARAKSNTPTPASIIRYAAQSSPGYQPYPRLPGEFESQKAILLSVGDLMPQHYGVLTQIVEKTNGRVPIVILYNSSSQLKKTVELLAKIDGDVSHVSFHKLKLDTIWLRDFGPRLAETQSGSSSIDFYYDGQRPLDDRFPINWGMLSGANINKVQWTMHGGNLLSNGQGLCIATSRIFVDNFIAFPRASQVRDPEFERRKIVVDALKKDCNINRLIVLEPLNPEATRHVDMFATFLAADRVVLASVDPRRDPYNARVLDNNAALLKQVKVDGKPMQVERIEIPIRQGKVWSPYTNIILANNLVLFPVYQSDPPELIRKAKAAYQNLLPNHHVDTVDMTSMQKLEGALHCMTINIPQFASLPRDVMTFAQASIQVTGSKYVANKQSTKPDVAHSNPKPLEKPATDNELERPQSSSSNAYQAARSKPENQANSNTTSTEPPSQTSHEQLQAVMTYRRRFTDPSGQYSLDAFAVGIRRDGVALLKPDTLQEVFVKFTRLSQADRQWINRNQIKITVNGPKVKYYLESSRNNSR